MLQNFEKKKKRLFLEKVRNIVGKGEDACYQHFLLFPQCFLPSSVQISIFDSHD